ncbi:MAG: TlpA family protein disulfide reductase [Bacteroidetes bacterium]|nr:TlpA family protein disulfide reductase [Bacteroidota bacterium]
MKWNFINFLLVFLVGFSTYSQNVQSEKEIIFVDTKETLNVQLEQFKGKIVYVDIWATFCSPCIKLFKYKKDYDDYFAKNDIVVLCLCVDNSKRKETWRKLVETNSVTGYHVFVDHDLIVSYKENLKASRKCRKTLGRGFPRFMIVDKNGVIVEDRAWPPSDKLVAQMNKYLN